MIKLSKTKREWREKNIEICEFAVLEQGQKFIGGRKVVMIYHSNRPAKDGYVDAIWIERIEIHHNIDGKCKTYFDERWHDALRIERAWDGSRFTDDRPVVRDVRIQRDGATLLVVEGDFMYSDFQAAELIGIKS